MFLNVFLFFQCHEIAEILLRLALNTNQSIILFFQKLRKQLDKLLEDKITKTGVTNWDKQSKEGILLHAIIDLITVEENKVSGR